MSKAAAIQLLAVAIDSLSHRMDDCFRSDAWTPRNERRLAELKLKRSSGGILNMPVKERDELVELEWLQDQNKRRGDADSPDKAVRADALDAIMDSMKRLDARMDDCFGDALPVKIGGDQRKKATEQEGFALRGFKSEGGYKKPNSEAMAKARANAETTNRMMGLKDAIIDSLNRLDARMDACFGRSDMSRTDEKFAVYIKLTDNNQRKVYVEAKDEKEAIAKARQNLTSQEARWASVFV